ncbi:hypothetical protein [Desulfovibrio sp. An276]|uniref:hypothetical protein n=1 Tax=Desulfovibrio sp. An276 TaxID=1965618 RepID=UPI0013A6452A|nr:hypothetical protein [Desulfovibrio sp. An276]
MRNAESGSDWNAGTDAEYEGGSGTGSGSGARAIAPWSAGAGDAILHALPEQGSGEEEQLQHVLSGRASEEAAQETAQEGKEAGRSSRRKTGRGTEPEPGTVAEQKSLFYVDKDALKATTMRPKHAPKATKTASASKAASKAACKTAAKTGAKPATKPLAGTGATANPSVQAMGQAGGQSAGQAPNALPAPRVFPRRAPRPLVPARRAALESRAASVPDSVLEELQDDVREEDLSDRVENAQEDMYVEEVPEFTDFRDREAPPIPRPVTGVGEDGSLYAIPDAASHFQELARNNPKPEPVSSDNGPHGFDDGRDALGTASYGTAGEIAVRQIASLRAQFAPTAEERLFGAQRAEEQVPEEQRDEAQSPKSDASQDKAEAWQADARARASAVTSNVSSEAGDEPGSANEPGGSGGNGRDRSRILFLGLVALFLALAAGYFWSTLSGPETSLQPARQATRASEKDTQRELAILESLGLEAQEEAGVPATPADTPQDRPEEKAADGAKSLEAADLAPASASAPDTDATIRQVPEQEKAAVPAPSDQSDPADPADPAGDATLNALRALAMELDTVRTSLSTLDSVLGAMDERTVRVLEGLNTLQSAVQSLQKDLERALLAKEARKARQARSARAEKSAKASRSTSERTVSRAVKQASRGPADWRVQGLHEDFAILRDASGRDWKVRAGSTIEDLAIVDIDYAKGRVATSKGDLFWRR